MADQRELQSGDPTGVLDIAAQLDRQRADGELKDLNAEYAAFTGLVRVVHVGARPSIQVAAPAASQQ